MKPESFRELYRMLRPRLVAPVRRRGSTTNGDIHPGMALLGCLRWLAGATIYEVRMLVGISKPAAYSLIHWVMDAINDCGRLAIRWPRTPEARRQAALGFRSKSPHFVIRRCVAAVDGIVIRTRKPSRTEHVSPDRFFSGHKKTVGLNMQVHLRQMCIFFTV